MIRLANAEIDKAFAGKPELEALARETTGMTLRGLGCYAEAQPQLQAALDIRRRLLGEDHPDTLRSALLLGDLILDTGRASEAEPLVRTALAGMERVYGPEHPKTLSCASILAVTLGDQCQHDDASRIFQRTLEAQRRILGPEHRDTLTTMWKWSVAYLARRVLPDGQDLAEELYETSQRTLGPDDSLNVLARPLAGWWHIVQGQYDQAEPLLRSGLAQCRRILGEEHPFTYLTMHGLAQSLQRAVHGEEAERLYRSALAGLRATRSRLHWQTLYVARDFAPWLDVRGRYDEAGRLYRELATDCAQAFGKTDLFALSTLSDLADFLERAGQFDDAVAVRRQRLEAIQGKYGAESPQVHAEHARLAEALMRIGRTEEARRITQQLLDSARDAAAAGEDDPRALNTYAWYLLTCSPPDLRNVDLALSVAQRAMRLSQRESPRVLDTLALAYYETGKSNKAAVTQSEALAKLPPRSRGRLGYLLNLMRYAIAAGDPVEARTRILALVERSRASFAKDKPHWAAQLVATAKRVADAGDFVLAETLLGEALQSSQDALGPGHLEVVSILAELANVYARGGKRAEAAAAYQQVLAARRESLGNGHLHVARPLHALGLVRYADRDVLGALDALNDAMAIYRRLGLEQSPAGLHVKSDFAAALAALDRLDDARPLAEEVLAQTRALYGDEHRQTVAAETTLSLIRIEHGNLKQAEASLRRCLDRCDRLDHSDEAVPLAATVEGTLGYCLTRMERFEEAEPLLLDSYKIIHSSVGDTHIEVQTAAQRLVALYAAWHRPEQETAWRAHAALKVIEPDPAETTSTSGH
jgi:tetratricopeptide (TPR) repeat protein